MNRRILALLLIAVSALPLWARESNVEPKPIGKHIAEFDLKDFRGKTHKLSDYSESKVVVLAFIGCECPVAKRYSVTLQQLADQFADDQVTILAVDANQHDSMTEMAAFARIHSLKIPFLKDLANRLADDVGARRTPEVVLLDQARTIQYRGRIDDHFLVGNVRDAATRNDLKIAIEEVLAGKKVSVPETDPVGCHIGRILEADESAEVTYSNQIARIFQNRCVECHREGQIAPFALTDYDEVVGWAEMIAEVVEDQRMPPWHADPKYGHFANDRHLSAKEKETILKWVEAGAPQGDLKQLPKPSTFVEGWTLPSKPEFVLNITDEPYAVPAEGEVKYKYFVVDPKFTEDKWIKAAELRPGNLQVVHHILCFALPPRANLRDLPQEGGARGFLVGYVPGKDATEYAQGMAKRVPAGSKLIFQMHYTPIGSPQEDQSQLGLIFADPQEIDYEVKTTSAVRRRLSIPPHASNHKEEADADQFNDDDTLLLTFMPHMHLRGKSFRYVAVGPDGREEILIDIPKYDFNWQTAYELAEPRKMTKGSHIHAIAHYDNSKGNLFNPDPTKTVRWGDQTWDEMMIGYFDIAVPVKPSEVATTDQPGKVSKEVLDKANQLITKFDTNQDGTVARSEVPEKGRNVFDRLDTNGDKNVTKQELIDIFQQYPAVMRMIR
ncbi:redoxin domain-containing protein [Bremerella sp. T1]|uniref:redoxin domain-containing protein n=1 Tax=Bremerella sp. TYQ1 TaxID=3119568 RepID=UPI001CCCB8D8|nr:redoxin domain-containing protein [Bremerella volcania]UBM36058.1 redoxin domain-containing protein [Bremerella volcania]